MKGKALLASVGLSVLFLVVYGFTNWFTSLRGDVPSFHWEWERDIPFVPLLIVPYMSIDLFFVAAPFLAKSRRELNTFSKRIAAAICAAGVCFLLFPLKFGFERPHVEGLLGLIFNNFRALDLPYNEFPSLHVALWMILIDMYIRRTRGVLRAAIVAWFALILPSTLLTWQHHVIDIFGGFALGALCLHFLREEPLRVPFSTNRRIAAYYALAALLLAGASLLFRPWTLVLLYPACSLAVVSVAYVFLGPGVFRKHNGRMPWTTWLLFWPSLLGQYFSLRHYARQCRAWDKLTDRVWIGRRLSNAEAGGLPIAAVIDLTSELPEPRVMRGKSYLPLPVLDLTGPLPGQIDGALGFIEQHEKQGVVYIHCKAGYSRTAVIAGAYLLATGRAATADDAVAILRGVRPAMVIRGEALEAIRSFERRQSHPGGRGPVPRETAAAQTPTG